jgi:FG-GAP-like repeat
VLLGNGDGTFQAAASYGVLTRPGSVIAADFNGDGKIDLATANFGGRPGTYIFGDTVSVLLGNGDGTFQAAVSYTVGTGPSSVATGDFNGDGKADLATADIASNTVSVLLGNGDGTFQTALSHATDVSPNSLTTGDFNDDGRLDLAAANQYGSTVNMLLGNGDGTFRTAPSYVAGMNPTSITTGDFDGDGAADLTVTGYYNLVTVLLNRCLP